MPVNITEQIEKERYIPENSRKKITLSIAGAAIFGALSVVLASLTTSIIPRLAWGIAIIDPVSIIWIVSLLIFGFWGGLLTVIIGTVGLLPFDPWTPYGPLMKFFATIWFVLVPYYYAKITLKRDFTSEDLKNKNFYRNYSIIAWMIRVPVMIILNYLVFIFLFGGYSDILAQNMSWIGLGGITGNMAVIITVFILNSVQTLFDTIIPYLLVFKTKLHEQFSIF